MWYRKDTYFIENNRIIDSPPLVSVVLCPSIALVAQIRAEYLQNASVAIRALAVCSDETAGYDPNKESTRNTASDPTLDNSNVSASAVKGAVTTNPNHIADWLLQGDDSEQVSVIFGTYQSGRAIADALKIAKKTITVLIADEAHRTAGLRQKRRSNSESRTKEERRIRDFTLCHDNSEFPARYRIYQTATPRVYDLDKLNKDRQENWYIRTMDDESTFGVELYRRSYSEAVQNGWLSDYRIIALGTNDPETYKKANELAFNTKSIGRRQLTTADYLRGLAFVLAMGGATQTQSQSKKDVSISSCIAFMNTVDKSKNMAEDLQTNAVREWLQNWLDENQNKKQAAHFTLEHLDASSNVVARRNAISRLGSASRNEPFGIINVGIFGEGTDSPSLNAVAFLEARRSPIDVIQAVGRAMRTSPDKKLGYIICPILIPPYAVPEDWLSSSAPEEGWQELGQILRALRAHDSRIEDNLADLMHLYLPASPEEVHTFVAIAEDDDSQIEFGIHIGKPDEAGNAVKRVISGDIQKDKEFLPISELETDTPTETSPKTKYDPSSVLTGKKNEDGSVEIRFDTPVNTKPSPDGTPGKLDLEKTKKKAENMINKGTGIKWSPRKKTRRRTHEEVVEGAAQQMLELTGLDEFGDSIKMNLLSKSGLVHNRIQRDLNILASSIKEAAFHMRLDELGPVLDTHFGLTNLRPEAKNKQADGVTIAALLMMNAAMLHQRISNGCWLPNITQLASIKSEVNVIREIRRDWERIMRHDFRPVLEPAVDVIDAVEDTGKLAGLERALRHLAAEAERIAEIYADIGADHAGPLFNKVMGNQASDGAYFTRPNAASIAARLVLDVYREKDWGNQETWENCKIVDLACGSGTLLAALLTEMKRRAKKSISNDTENKISALQKLAVEQTIKGLDINSVSLQLAASQLTTGNQNIRYKQMGLYLMPYGPISNASDRVYAGSLELLGQKSIVSRKNEFDFDDESTGAQQVSLDQRDDADLEDAVNAVKNAQIVIMNPPFTNRTKMGEKYPRSIQNMLRLRTDSLEKVLVHNDIELDKFVDRSSIEPLFLGLADKCLAEDFGILAIIIPTIALTAPSAFRKRVILAKRYNIHSILTCHLPGQINLSQNTSINESLVIAARKPSNESRIINTRIINLDKFPSDEKEVADLHECLLSSDYESIINGWGQISEWPAERIEAGDWSSAVWRSPKLADAATRLANDTSLKTIKDSGFSSAATGPVLRSSYQPASSESVGSFPILKSKGSEGQLTIRSIPDEYWMLKRQHETHQLPGLEKLSPTGPPILQKAGYLLITAGQRNNTARLTATASDSKFVGNGWSPVSGTSPDEGKALAVFLNSTAGRLMLMRCPGRSLDFPIYSNTEINNLKIPDVKNEKICNALSDCWESTKNTEVPQFRDGECEVRKQWDDSVAEALNWDAQELTHLRKLLHKEPHVRGRGYNQYSTTKK